MAFVMLFLIYKGEVIPMTKFSMIARFTAKPGERDTLAAILLEAAANAGGTEDCQQYIIHYPADQPDVIVVTEIWSNAEAHAASLALDETRATIQRAMPLIAGVESTRLTPIGGKGA